MTPAETQEHIRDKLVALIARHAGVPSESIERHTSIWQCFPPSRTEDPSVTSFVEGVHADFDVYLTEDEWDAPSLDRLTQIVSAKRANPAHSVDDWQHELSETKKGFRSMFISVSVVFGPMTPFLPAGSLSRRPFAGLGIVALMNGLILFAYIVTMRRLRSKQPKNYQASKG